MKKHKGVTMLLAGLILTIIGAWPIGIPIFCIGPIFLIFDIYTNYYDKKREQQENETFRAGTRVLTQQSYEEWKAERDKQEP